MNVRLHVSADERYELCIDGRFVSAGPHRSDPMHWAFSSYDVQLDAGEHCAEAVVWKLGKLAPFAQMSCGGGFILAAEGLESQLNTGAGPWRVQHLTRYRFSDKPMYRFHVVGPREHVDAGAGDGPLSDPVVFADPIPDGATGTVQPRWRLEPSPLPDMMRRPITPGVFRALRAPSSEPWRETGDCAAANALLGDGKALAFEANTQCQLLLDLGDYYCGYPTLTVDGGDGACIDWEWSESLFEPAEDVAQLARKYNRDVIDGKLFYGFGDTFRPTDGNDQSWRTLWWRCGRYVQLTVTVADQPLRITHLGLDETRYPREADCVFTCCDTELNAVMPMAVRGIHMCSHETLMDCPYYEQLMYVGDSRLQLLVAYVMSADDRLTRRALELLDYSRWNSGFVNERYPSDPFQQSLTFCMIYVAMVRDYALWRDDVAFVRRRLPAVRSVMDNLLALCGEDGLLHRVPGWPFVDWVDVWSNGNPPGAIDGDSSVVNLHLLTALRSAADLEAYCGDKHMASRFAEAATTLAERIVATWWDDTVGCIADTSARDLFSEHAQCLALINDVLSKEQTERCFKLLQTREDLARTTVYFSHYLFETFYQFGAAEPLLARMDLWKEQVALGLKTPAEKPEPSRSDCHAWGAHPLYHMIASLAGVRPASMGFATVRIAPLTAAPRPLHAEIPHPRGRISIRLGTSQAVICLPPAVSGTFVWGGVEHAICNDGRECTFNL